MAAVSHSPRSLLQPEVLIVGLGVTGLSVARFLAARGVAFAAVDSRPEPPGLGELRQAFPQAPIRVGGFDEALLAGVRQVVVSPGVSLEEPMLRAARDRGLELVGDIELFARHARAPVAAVTGSNGKSTVTALLAAMAEAAGWRLGVGGNLGTPALDLLADPEPELYCLELSSFQLETVTSLHAQTAVVLNVSPDHMDRHRDLSAYAAAKGRIYRGARVPVVNRDDPVAAGLAGEAGIGFTLGPPARQDYGLEDGDWLSHGGRRLLRRSELALPGRHNAANALAALAMAHALDIPEAAALQALRAFEGLPHRSQLVARAGGVAWYDDSKATNVGAAVAALEGMDGPVVLIAGGLAKGQAFEPLRPAVARRARAVVLMGQDADQIAAALQGTVPVERAAGMAEAVAAAGRLAQPGDSVLLSPACASFDMFADYQERGRAFAEAARRLSP